MNDLHSHFSPKQMARMIKQFAKFWSQDEIALMTTEQILAKLDELGIPVTVEEFLTDVASCNGSGKIYEQWESRFEPMIEGRDADFPWMAADVLWRRLVPHQISTEQLADLVQEGYDVLAAGDLGQACQLWLDAWNVLKPRLTPAMRNCDEVDAHLGWDMYLSNWSQDLETELHNAAIDRPELHESRIRFCREFCQCLPDSRSVIPRMKRAVAESLFLSGRTEEAEREFALLVEDAPDDPWNLILWGDMYASKDHPSYNCERAEALYRKALGSDSKEDNIIRERIGSLQRPGRKGGRTT
jgi:hypothetical protein